LNRSKSPFFFAFAVWLSKIATGTSFPFAGKKSGYRKDRGVARTKFENLKLDRPMATGSFRLPGFSLLLSGPVSRAFDYDAVGLIRFRTCS